MPHYDPRLNPALDVARPSDSPGSSPSYRRAHDPWRVVFGSGDWQDVQVLAWWQDRYRRWVAQLDWHVRGEGTYTETYLADPGKMVPNELPCFSPWERDRSAS